MDMSDSLQDIKIDHIFRMESLTSTPEPSLSNELRALINQRNILTEKSKSKVLKDLDLQIEKNKNLEQLGLRSKVEEEIFTSELSYLHQLEIILKFFKEPLEHLNLMAPVTRRSLFGNIESIYQVNGELVNQLKLHGNNVGCAFLFLAPFFKLYSMYAYDYKNSLYVLEDISKRNRKLSSWIESQENRPEVGTRLTALLIAPIQRLPRYRLLLRQLLSLTPFTHPQHSTLTEAVKEIEKATAYIDSSVFEQETHARLVKLQQCFVRSRPSIVGPNKRLLKEGILMKMSANGEKAQRRYFILLNDSIVYCKLQSKDHDKLPEELASLHCCCVLPIGKCRVESVLGQSVFNLTCRSETYILFSEHSEISLEWIAVIQKTISQYHENMKTLRKKCSSRRPLHLSRKRKCHRVSNMTTEDEDDIPLKRPMTHQRNMDEDAARRSYIQSVKSIFQSFGECIKQYIYPNLLSRRSSLS